MEFRDDTLFLDKKYGDLYVVLDREPNVIFCRFESDADEIITITMKNELYDFYAEVYNDYPLYRSYRMFNVSGSKYVKVPIGVDKEADFLLCEHFTIENFVMVSPWDTHHTDLGRLVDIQHPKKGDYIEGKKIANKVLLTSKGFPSKIPRYRFINYDIKETYFRPDEIEYIDKSVKTDFDFA